MRKKLFSVLAVATVTHSAAALNLCTPATVNPATLTAIIPYEPIAAITATMGCLASTYSPGALGWSVPVINDSLVVSIDPKTGGAGMVMYVSGVTGVAVGELASRDMRTGIASWIRSGQ